MIFPFLVLPSYVLKFALHISFSFTYIIFNSLSCSLDIFSFGEMVSATGKLLSSFGSIISPWFSSLFEEVRDLFQSFQTSFVWELHLLLSLSRDSGEDIWHDPWTG